MNGHRKIATEKAPAAVGPYSQAIEAGDTLYCSGQIPLDPSTGLVVGTTIEDQTRQVLMNVAAVLEAAGYRADEVIKTTCFLTDLDNFVAFNDLYAEYFSHCPARSTVQVAALPKQVLVEIEVLAKH